MVEYGSEKSVLDIGIIYELTKENIYLNARLNCSRHPTEPKEPSLYDHYGPFRIFT